MVENLESLALQTVLKGTSEPDTAGSFLSPFVNLAKGQLIGQEMQKIQAKQDMQKQKEVQTKSLFGDLTNQLKDTSLNEDQKANIIDAYNIKLAEINPEHSMINSLGIMSNRFREISLKKQDDFKKDQIWKSNSLSYKDAYRILKDEEVNISIDPNDTVNRMDMSTVFQMVTREQTKRSKISDNMKTEINSYLTRINSIKNTIKSVPTDKQDDIFKKQSIQQLIDGGEDFTTAINYVLQPQKGWFSDTSTEQQVTSLFSKDELQALRMQSTTSQPIREAVNGFWQKALNSMGSLTPEQKQRIALENGVNLSKVSTPKFSDPVLKKLKNGTTGMFKQNLETGEWVKVG